MNPAAVADKATLNDRADRAYLLRVLPVQWAEHASLLNNILGARRPSLARRPRRSCAAPACPALRPLARWRVPPLSPRPCRTQTTSSSPPPPPLAPFPPQASRCP
jgi:hypothetical protein